MREAYFSSYNPGKVLRSKTHLLLEKAWSPHPISASTGTKTKRIKTWSTTKVASPA